MASGSAPCLKGNFKKFATRKDGSELTSKDCTRWFKDCGVLGKKLTSQSLDIAYSAAKKKNPALTVGDMDVLCDKVAKDYAADKKISVDDAKLQMKEKLAGGEKQSHGTTKTANKATTDNMTDASKYTGAHKERFDASGKGKGIEGRADVADNSGYVGNYKGEKTYDKK